MPGPVRRCAACRDRRPKQELLRFVRQPHGVDLDPGQVSPGRGGYCCPDEACIEKALRRGGLARTLRTTLGNGDASRLAGRAVEYLRERKYGAGDEG
ncbi:MAG TPA: YlxR family protein [Actinomycetota bacterium]|nr:YlxR family protein [Actinomycetota bacterium]